MGEAAPLSGAFLRRPTGDGLARLQKTHSLAWQLVGWFSLLALLPLLLLTLAASLNARAILTREATNSLLAIAERQSRQLESTIEERERTVSALSRTPSIGAALDDPWLLSDPTASRELREFLTQFQESSGWEDILLVTVGGDVVLSVSGARAIGTNLRNGPYASSGLARVFDRALMTLGTEISDLAYDPSADRPASYVATPVLRDGFVTGVLAMRLSTRELVRIVNDAAGLGKTGETIVAAPEGNEAVFLTPVRNDPEAAFRRRVSLASVDGSAGTRVVRGRIRAGSATDYRGRKVLAVYDALPHLGWLVMVKIDAAEAFAPVARFRLVSTLVEVPLLALVLMAVVSVSRSISRPIVKLTAATRAFAGGDLSRRAPLVSHNEIRVLAAAFNQMGAKLQSSIIELERYSRTLEGRVADRTKELLDKNQELEAAMSSLKKAQEQILLQEKMASLGSLTAGIAHEIKNPLNFVNNFAGLMLELVVDLEASFGPEAGKLTDRTREDVEALLADLKQNAAKVQEHGKRADGIVKSMLFHARGKSSQRQPIDVNQLVSEAVNLAYHSMRGSDTGFNIKMDLELDPKAGSLEAVPQDLSRVFLNLVNNAMYATHERKKTERSGYEPVLTVRTLDLGDKVEVRVRDNGTGIPQPVLEKIFLPFFTTKPTGSGTGLGLSISYDIVTAGHGGTLSVQSEVGRFAEFVVTLPRVSGARS